MRIRRKQMRLKGKLIGSFLALGISSGITQSVACIMQVVMNNSLVYYGDKSPIGGDVALSAMGIVMKIAMIMGAFGIGVGIGAQPILGYNRGAGKYRRIKRDIHMGRGSCYGFDLSGVDCLPDETGGNHRSLRQGEPGVYRLCGQVPQNLSVQYLLRGLSDRIHQLFSGDRSAAKGIAALYAAPAAAADTADTYSAALYGVEWNTVFCPCGGCCVCGYRCTFHYS